MQTDNAHPTWHSSVGALKEILFIHYCTAKFTQLQEVICFLSSFFAHILVIFVTLVAMYGGMRM